MYTSLSIRSLMSSSSLSEIASKYVNQLLQKYDLDKLDIYQLFVLLKYFETIQSELSQIIVERISQQGLPQLYKACLKAIEKAKNDVDNKIANKNIQLIEYLAIYLEDVELIKKVIEKIYEKVIEILKKEKERG